MACQPKSLPIYLMNLSPVDTDVVLKIFGQSLSMGKNLGLTGIVLMVKKQVQDIEEKT